MINPKMNLENFGSKIVIKQMTIINYAIYCYIKIINLCFVNVVKYGNTFWYHMAFFSG